MTAQDYVAGAYVLGSPAAPRELVRHADLLAAYADGGMVERDETREGYLSHFVYGPEMPVHYAAHRNSVAGFAGPCRCRWLVFDIDRPDIADALAAARALVRAVGDRYPERDGRVPVYFSGGKGFHVLLDLGDTLPPSARFPAVAKAFAEALAARAGVAIDAGVYDVNRLIRLPNTRHPRTGLYKRRIDADDLFRLDARGILTHAAHPAGDGLPAAGPNPARLTADWADAGRAAGAAIEVRSAARRDAGPTDARAPKYFTDFVRYGAAEGDRHRTLFRCAAWMSEQGAPPTLVAAVLTDPGLDSGLTPADVARQIACGVAHAARQRGPAVPPPADLRPDPAADPDGFERWAVENEPVTPPPGVSDFPFGALAPAAEGRAA